MIDRIVILGSLGAALAVPAYSQQPAAAAPPGPVAGDLAPDFTAPGAAMSGTLKAPIRLSDLKGKTVVLAFFPKARTSGCTQQMTQYREQYEKLFMGGKGVVLLGISTDADTTLANWAKEARFPFQFVSDKEGLIGKAYGTLLEGRTAESRYVYVIAPDGKISYTKKPFSPFTPAQYDELGAEIMKAMGHANQ